MSQYQHSRLEAILSLEWYELALTVLFSFVAKTSEVLLAFGLIITTTHFLTDGSIMAANPGLSTAWAWAQSISLDSSLAVCLSYTFQYVRQKDWIKGVLYGLLTLLLSLVAGVITTIDIVSHALHIPINNAIGQMGINVVLLSQLRAVAVVGFILIGRLRTVPFKDQSTEAAPASQAGNASAKGPIQEASVQKTIQLLCSQFSTEEVAQIINACITARKITFTRLRPKSAPGPHERQMDQECQDQGNIAHQNGAAPEQEDEGPLAQTVLEPFATTEPFVREPLMERDHHLRTDPESVSEPLAQVLQEPGHEEPPIRVPDNESAAPGAEPLDGASILSEPVEGAAPEETPVEREERLELAYQSLLAEGKKPSGRALAERAHVHRATCVEWLRTRHQEGLFLEEAALAESLPEQLQAQQSPEPVEYHQEQDQEQSAS